MELKELRRLIKTCRKLGVSHIKNGEVEITIEPLDTHTQTTRTQKKQVTQDELLEAEVKAPTPDELLFWSTNAMDGAFNENNA